jgi:hypothetical protein
MEAHLLPQSYPADPQVHAPSAGGCTNCGAAMIDVFCARCGERQPDHHDYAVSHFAHHAWHELFHVDSKLFVTLRLLMTKPGFLAQEYFAGRKLRYLAPIRLFLTFFALQLIAFTAYKPVAIFTTQGLATAGNAAPVEHLMQKVASARHMEIDAVRERVNEKWQHNLSLIQLLTLVFVAIVLKMLYRKRYYVEHLVFAAHFLTFTYITSLLWWPFYVAFGFVHVRPVSMVVGTAVMLVYFYFGVRRFYGSSRGGAVFKTAVGYFASMLVQGLIMGLSLIAAILQLRFG